jgi:DNA segregation ATPase FtsK/SpoIIIE-like protein
MNSILIGHTDDGAPVTWDTDTVPHMLIVGPAGAGKTVLVNSLAASCEAEGWGSAQTSRSMELSEVERMLDSVHLEMFERLDSTTADRWPPILLVIDETIERLQTADAELRQRCRSRIEDIAATGRAAGIHLVITVNRATADVLPSTPRDNLTARVALGGLPPVAAQIMFGSTAVAGPRPRGAAAVQARTAGDVQCPVNIAARRGSQSVPATESI